MDAVHGGGKPDRRLEQRLNRGILQKVRWYSIEMASGVGTYLWQTLADDEQARIDFMTFQWIVCRVFAQIIARIATAKIDVVWVSGLPTQDRICPSHIVMDTHLPR